MKPSVKGHVAGILSSLILTMIFAGAFLWPRVLLGAIIVFNTMLIIVVCIGIVYWIAYNILQL